MDNLFGFLNVYKPVGMTSHDVVAILRRATKTKQIGHTGTLDPFAQGVLPIAIGKATRLIEFLEDDKEYLAEVSFGKSTDTYDCEGQVTATSDKKISKEELLEKLENFKGEITQFPPIYSAIKVKGKKLYEYARAGEEVKIEPREIFIEKIELKSFDETNQKAEILIKCSKGTYIRSIAYDLGQELQSQAHLSKLIRTQAGEFLVQNSINLDEFDSIEKVQANILNPIDLIPFKRLELSDEENTKIKMGQFLQNKKEFEDGKMLILIYNEEISAIATVSDNLIKAKKVF